MIKSKLVTSPKCFLFIWSEQPILVIFWEFDLSLWPCFRKSTTVSKWSPLSGHESSWKFFTCIFMVYFWLIWSKQPFLVICWEFEAKPSLWPCYQESTTDLGQYPVFPVWTLGVVNNTYIFNLSSLFLYRSSVQMSQRLDIQLKSCSTWQELFNSDVILRRQR